MGIRFGVLRRFGQVLVLGAIVAGCGSGAASSSMLPPSPPQSIQSSSPSRAQATDGAFTLTFEMPKSIWSTSEEITGTATLAYSGTDSIVIGDCGTPFGFAFRKSGSDIDIEPAWPACLTLDPMSAASPKTSGIVKSGGFIPGTDPFAASFFAEKPVHLPAGEWTITAVVTFATGLSTDPGATGTTSHEIRASVNVEVV